MVVNSPKNFLCDTFAPARHHAEVAVPLGRCLLLPEAEEEEYSGFLQIRYRLYAANDATILTDIACPLVDTTNNRTVDAHCSIAVDFAGLLLLLLLVLIVLVISY